MIKKNRVLDFMWKNNFVHSVFIFLKDNPNIEFSEAAIINNLGVSIEKILSHFNAIEDLQTDLIETFSADCKNFVKDAVKKAEPGLDALKEAILAYAIFFFEHPNVFKLMFLSGSKFKDSISPSALLDELTKPYWNQLVFQELLSEIGVQKAAGLIKFQISGLLLHAINFGFVTDKVDFISIVNRQINEIIAVKQHAKAVKTYEERLLHNIFTGEENIRFFIHYTKRGEIAQKILSEGFLYTESFHNSAEEVTNDKLDLAYKHSMFKLYGSYVVVIGIADDILKKFTEIIREKNIDAYVENILTETKPCYDEEEEEAKYLLPKQYIKGFFNYESGNFTSNSDYNPEYESLVYVENVNNFGK